MKKILLIVMMIQGVLVSGIVKNIEVDGIKIPIIYEKNSALPIVSFQLVIKNAGSMHDGDNAGLAKFTSAMLGEGTKKKGSITFAEELEFKAISLSAHAGTETFVFELSSLKEEYRFGMKMLGELLRDPNFSQESFEKIQQLTLGGLSSKKTNYDYVASLNLKKEIFKDTPIGHAFGGEIDSIEALRLEDVKSFYNKYIDITNAMVVIGGDIEFADAESSIKELLSGFKQNEKRELSTYQVASKTKDIEVIKETEQAYIYFGSPLHIKAEDEDRYKAKVAAFILGESGFGSRLMEEIRVKRGLAYSAYGRMNINRSNSYFSGYLQTKNENLEDAKKLVKEVITQFIKSGVTKDELEQAKKFLLGSEPLRNETLSQRLGRAFTEFYRGNELGYTKKQLKFIEKLELKDLNDYIMSLEEITDLTFSVVTQKSETK